MAKFVKCPKCGGSLRPAKALAGNDSKFWRECSNTFCGTLVDTYEPYGMQYNFLADSHKYKGAFGGFGSGKSLAVIKHVEKSGTITENGYIAIIGFTHRQLRRNFKKDFDEEFPVRLAKQESGQKTPGFNQSEMVYTLRNGTKIELITADDAGKIRGLNATLIVIIEASNVSFEIFDSLKSRLRNQAAMSIRKNSEGKEIFVYDEKTGETVPDYDHDWMHILLESNPEANWINKKFLLEADRVQFYGNSYNKYSYTLGNINPEYSLHISATDANPFLPKNYLEVNTKGKPLHEIKRFYYGSFLFSADMVYPRFSEAVVDPYPIDFNDKNIYFIIGYDYGLADQSAFVFLAVNFEKNLLIQYDELMVVEMSIKEIAKPYREKLALIPEGKLLMMPKMDAKSYNKRQADKVTIGSMFEDIGLYFEPIQEDPVVRQMKLNSLINNAQIQIFRTCNFTIDQGMAYKKVRNSKGEITGKRVDKNNHFPDALEFATIKLPVNLEKMKIDDWIKPGHLIVADKFRKKITQTLTPRQELTAAMNPFNFEKRETYEEFDYNEEDYDKIISKLSGI